MTEIEPSSQEKTRRGLWYLLGILILCRVMLMAASPLTDTSESRYAEIARKMVETGNWITPQFDYGVPFWAKPPLAMWMSAAGIKLFGANEFGSRVFIFCGALGLLAIVARMARRQGGPSNGLAAAALLMGMPLFFYCSAAVMTDLALVIGTTMAMAGFRSAVTGGSTKGGYQFFVGIAIGLLAKGPLALVLIAVPVVTWTAVCGRWKETWKNLPWIGGTLLMLGLSVPWYILAERSTPGFLDYFLVGEHWRRFTVQGWKGDRYGSAHAVAPGTIWLHAIWAVSPWCCGLLILPWRRWRELKRWALAGDGWGLYLILWALWPLVFFTPARNIIPTYPLPALPALALLLTEIWAHRSSFRTSWLRPHPLHPLPVILCGVMITWAMVATFAWPGLSPKLSAREVVHLYQQDRGPGDGFLYYGPRRYSAEFYLRGHVDFTASVPEIESKLDPPGRLYFVMPAAYMKLLPASLQQRFETVGEAGQETLYRERQELPSIAQRASTQR